MTGGEARRRGREGEGRDLREEGGGSREGEGLIEGREGCSEGEIDGGRARTGSRGEGGGGKGMEGERLREGGKGEGGNEGQPLGGIEDTVLSSLPRLTDTSASIALLARISRILAKP